MRNRIKMLIDVEGPHNVNQLAKLIDCDVKILNYIIENPTEELPIELAKKLADYYKKPIEFIFGLSFRCKNKLDSMPRDIQHDILYPSPKGSREYWEFKWLGGEFSDSSSSNVSYKDKAFIAMSFNTTAFPELVDIRNALKSGIEKAGYIPEVVDEIETNNYITFEIFDRIKNCKFLVLDTTVENYGAYYEAGFAKGEGKQIIICCKKSKFIAESDHFDIRQINHILWEDYEDLVIQLARRIKLTVY